MLSLETGIFHSAFVTTSHRYLCLLLVILVECFSFFKDVEI